MIDEKNMHYFGGEWKDKYVEEHPTQEGAINVSEVLYDSFNR